VRPDQTVPADRLPEGPLAGALFPGLGFPMDLTVAATVDAPAAARAAITAWMAGHVTASMLADARQVVGELVADSVRHADAPGDGAITVRAEARAGGLLLEVTDGGDGGLVARLLRADGFGLNAVEALACRWGVERDAGTCVWAELPFAATG
jgi:anti-sigma regulatory factor (Ser/Thr protein kinase)